MTSDAPSGRRIAAQLLPFVTLLVLGCFLAGTSADADLWGHLTFGRDIVRNHRVHAFDPYSFTSDLVWVNHEWLAEAIMWAFYAAGGSVGLIVLKLSLAWAAGALLLDAWRTHRLTPMQRDLILFATALGAWPSLATVRPQAFSLLFVAALLNVLARVREQPRALLWLPVIFGLWVNIHGGWIVGAGVLVVFVTVSLFDRSASWSRLRLLLVASLAAGLATLCNPYGWRMIGFLFETVRPDRADIVEWRPVTSLPTTAFVLWLVPTTVASIALWRRRGAMPAWSIAIVAMLAIASFRVVRIVSLYSIAVGFLLAPYAWSDVVERVRPARRTAREWGVAALAYVVVVGVSIGLWRGRVHMDADWLPEPEAAAYVASSDLHGRMFTWFDYGEYAIWHFWPAIRVSIDGRRETVFSEELRDAHRRVYENAPDALDRLRRIDPDYVWLPNELPVIPRLEAAGWVQLFRGERSTILGRAVVRSAGTAAVTPVARIRVFPGP